MKKLKNWVVAQTNKLTIDNWTLIGVLVWGLLTLYLLSIGIKSYKPNWISTVGVWMYGSSLYALYQKLTEL